MNSEVSRRSVLGVAGVAAATVGAGLALSSCSSDDKGTTTGESSAMFARVPQRDPLQGKVLLHDTFDDGFNGWRDHYNASGPCPPLSLTSYPVFSGSHALMIGCSAPPDDGYTDGWESGRNSAAFKNLSRYYDGNLVTFSCYLTHGSDRTTAALGGYWLMIDTQSWDSSRRSFYKLMVNRDPASGQRSLSVSNNDAKPVKVYNGTDLFAGDNENKFNFDWISLTVDLDANNGLGGYHSCQVNSRAFDVTGLAGQNAKEAPQQGSAMESFGGGLNFGVLLYPGAAGTGESFLVLDEVVATVDEVA